jgi:hypothetical protein
MRRRSSDEHDMRIGLRRIVATCATTNDDA